MQTASQRNLSLLNSGYPVFYFSDEKSNKAMLDTHFCLTDCSSITEGNTSFTASYVVATLICKMGKNEKKMFQSIYQNAVTVS